MAKNPSENVKRRQKPDQPLRRGWTTGCCATAATKAALQALCTGQFGTEVSIRLPKGETPSFALVDASLNDNYAEVGIIKDAGDDPDVTHGAVIKAKVQYGEKGAGISFQAGEGVGVVTKAGLPLSVGEAAINPVPRAMMTAVVQELCDQYQQPPDIKITISVPGGEEMARQTWNPRLGIKGGISILGTTGIVHPFSCSAWIDSIHKGIDVCRANGIDHVLGATGSMSETAACRRYDFEDAALLDMGDFVGAVLKYLRSHPIEKLTLAGGFAKFVKLAQGALDLHSKRSQVDFEALADLVDKKGANPKIVRQIRAANTALEVLLLSESHNLELPEIVASLAYKQAKNVLREAPVDVEILIVSRDGELLARYET